MLTILSYAYWPCVCPLWRSVYLGPFNWVVCVLVLSFVKFFMNFGYLPLFICIRKYVLSVGCLFILWMISFAVQELFSLIQYYLFIFLLFPFPFVYQIYLIKYCYKQCPRLCCLCFLLQFLWFWI